MLRVELYHEYKGITVFNCIKVTTFEFNNKKYRQYWLHKHCYWMLPISMVKSEEEI